MTMWILAMLGVALTASARVSAVQLAVGDQLPPLKGEFLSGRTAVLPQAASGRVALLMLGFTYDSRFQVEEWAKRFRQDFGTKPGVTFFEIPMIGGVARMGKWFIAAYLILIDQHGRVAWRIAGSLDEQRYSALSSEVSKLLSAN